MRTPTGIERTILEPPTFMKVSTRVLIHTGTGMLIHTRTGMLIGIRIRRLATASEIRCKAGRCTGT
jgi:hypothetical protein